MYFTTWKLIFKVAACFFRLFLPFTAQIFALLPIIAVMFTFSFSSAFAVTKADYNETLAKTYFDSVMKTVKESASGAITLTGNGRNYEVGYAVLDANYAAIFAAATDFVKAQDEAYIGNGSDASYQVNRLEYVLNQVADNQELKMTLVAAQYAVDKQEAIDVLNGLDLSDYSTAELTDTLKKALDDKCTTYVEHIKHLISDAVDEINDATFTSDSEVDAYAKAKGTIDGYFFDADATGTKDNTKVLAVEKYYDGKDGKVGLGIYELNEDYVVAGTTLASFTTTAVAGADAVDAAQVAAWKASTAQKYAAYLNTKDADTTYAANVKKVFDFLAENGINPTGWDAYFAKDAAKTYAKKFAAAIANVEQFEVEAARYAAETDVNGVLLRDAKDVADLVTEGTINEYLATTGIGPNTAKNYKTIDEALAAIYSLYASLDEELLAFEKKVRETAVADFLAEAEAYETYYPAELAKVKELTTEYLAKVNAITDVDKILADKDGYDKDYQKKVKDVKTAEQVDAAGNYSALITAATQYADILNKQLKGDNKYYLGENNAKVIAEINKLVGNAGARTTKEINALSGDAIALVTSLPTVGAVDAAKDAADDAVKALPRTAKVADKALVDAAIAAVDAYETISAATYGGKAVENAVLQYAYAVNNELTAKVKAVDKTDKAALKALKDEINTFVDTYEDYAAKDAVADVFKTNKDKLNGYLKDIQDAAAAAVTKAIAAIPVKANLTEAHKATVEAARKAYDAYVAEYTDYYTPYNGSNGDGFVADDFNYQSLFNAETQLGLNAPAPGADVQALKIKASSKATKGAITVKWTVKGNKAAADGYQLYKSTKAQKGYKKCITTKKTSFKNTKNLKKGVRYFYKVRAYKVVDGKTYYSDWSNKANRIAK